MSNTIVRTREQKGHSVAKHLIFGVFIGYLNLPFLAYYAFSKDHYLHF